MLDKYPIAQIASFSLGRIKKKKKKKKEYQTTLLQVISHLFLTPIFSDAEMKGFGNSIVRFFKNMSMKLTKINKSEELTSLLTFGCLVSHVRKFALRFWVHYHRLPLTKLPDVL